MSDLDENPVLFGKTFLTSELIHFAFKKKRAIATIVDLVS